LRSGMPSTTVDRSHGTQQASYRASGETSETTAPGQEDGKDLVRDIQLQSVHNLTPIGDR
jgi:hypothetical protein